MLAPASPAHGRIAAQHAPRGAGIGLRPIHHEYVRGEQPHAAWLELHPENFLRGGVLSEDLDDIGAFYPLSFHAVGMSLGSARGVSRAHLRRLARLIDRHQPVLVSDHLSWSMSQDAHLPDLLPLPYTRETLAIVARNVAWAQDVLQRRLLIENPSTYLRFSHSSMSEAAFLAELVVQTGCGVLLDLNNLYVSAQNAGLPAEAELRAFLSSVPGDAIGEIHLAGHAILHDQGFADLRVDDHGSPVCDEVWALFQSIIQALGPKPTLVEWDTGIPAFAVLAAEAAKAQLILDQSLSAGLVHADAG